MTRPEKVPEGSPRGPSRGSRAARFLQPAWIVVSTVIVIALAVGILLATTGLLGSDDGGGPSEPSSDTSGGYATGRSVELCDELDTGLYREIVGSEPGKTPGDDMCLLGFIGGDDRITTHQLWLFPTVAESVEEAQVHFEGAEAELDEPSKSPVEGPWDSAVAGRSAEDGTYRMAVLDDNLMIEIRQSVHPEDALAQEDSLALMTGYAKQVQEAYR